MPRPRPKFLVVEVASETLGAKQVRCYLNKSQYEAFKKLRERLGYESDYSFLKALVLQLLAEADNVKGPESLKIKITEFIASSEGAQ